MFNLLVVSAFLATACASDVLVFTEENFNRQIRQHPFTLVMFYAPWCSHSKRLLPEYEKAATKLKHDNPPIELAKVDCVAEEDMCDDFGIKGFPTLKLFVDGKYVANSSARDAHVLIQFVRAKANPGSRLVSNMAELKALHDKDEFLVCGYFESENSPLFPAFKKLVDDMSEEFRFCHSFASELHKGRRESHMDRLVAFQARHLRSTFEPAVSTFENLADTEAAKKFIRDAERGLCGHRTSVNADSFGYPLVIVYYDADYFVNAKVTKYWRKRVLQVAKKMISEEKKNIQFAISSHKEYKRELEGKFGFSNETDFEKPRMVAIDAANRKYVSPDPLSPSALESFANSLLDGTLEPYVKSQPIPTEPHKAGESRVVVAKNFDEIVNDPTKDVFILFYAPWCRHCNSLEPDYAALALAMKDEPEVVIAKMDATANDALPPYQVSSYPTFYLAPKDGKRSPLHYDGDRKTQDFIDFLAKEATNPLKGWDRNGKKRDLSKKEL